jgi:hypothetical protein
MNYRLSLTRQVMSRTEDALDRLLIGERVRRLHGYFIMPLPLNLRPGTVQIRQEVPRHGS